MAIKKKKLTEQFQEKAQGKMNESAYTGEANQPIVKTKYNNSTQLEMPKDNFWNRVQNRANNIMKDTQNIFSNLGLGIQKSGKSSMYYIQNLSEQNSTNFKLQQQQQSYLKNKEEEQKAIQNGNYAEYMKNNPYIKSTNVINGLPMTQYNSAMLTSIDKSIQKDEEKIQKNIEETTNPIAQKIAKLTPSIGQSVAGMGLSAINPAIGLSYWQTSAGGDYTRQAKQNGMSDEDARIYGTIMGTMESGTEWLGGKLTEGVGKAVAKNGALEGLKSLGLDIGENFFEEAIMEPIQEAVVTLTGGKEFADWSDMGTRMLQSGIDGALTSILMGGASAGIGKAVSVVTKAQNGQQVTQKEISEALKEINKNEEIDIENILKNSFGFNAEQMEVTRQNVDSKMDNIANQLSQQEGKNIINSQDQIKNSGLTENQKEKIREIVKKYDLRQPDIQKLIDGTKNGKYAENQTTTMKNKPLLPQKQQVTLPEVQNVQNETSQQIENVNENTTFETQNIKQNQLSQEETNKIISEKLYKNTYTNSENAKTFFESAVNNNFDINSKEIETISKILDNRNLKGSFNSEVFNGDTNKGALYVNGEIVLNPNTDSKKGLYDLVLHETTHSILDNAPDLRNTVLETLKSDSRYEQMYNDVVNRYSEEYKNSENFNSDIEEEMIADYLGENLSTEEFMTSLEEAQKTKNQSKIKQVIDNFIQKIKDFFTSRFGVGIKETDAKEYYWNKIENLFYDTYLNTEVVEDENNKYSIGGKIAKENLIKSNGNNTNLEKMYNEAIKLTEKRVDNETIRKQTHWFQDKNGDWKFEFSDKDMKLKKFLKENSNYKLGDILDHDILFDLYPELKQYNVETVNLRNNAKGSHVASKKTIYISNKLLTSNKNIEATLIHEIQHAIQKSENFEGGKSTNKSKLAYYNSLGEIEANDVSKRFIKEKYNKKDLSNILPESSKKHPKHSNLDSYLENRGIVDKVKDKVYSGLKDYLSQKSEDYNESFEENNSKNNNQNSNMVVERRRYLEDNISNKELEKNSSSFSMPQNENILVNTKGNEIDISKLQETSQMKLNTYNRKYNKDNIIAYRGVSENSGNNSAMYGLGLYTTLDKNYASKYGNVEIVEKNLLPDNPLKFRTQNDFQMWEQDLASQLGIRYSELLGNDYGIEKYVKKLGYDGLMIGTGKDTDLISFKDIKSNIRYSQNIDGEWNNYLKETSRNKENRKKIKELRNAYENNEIMLKKVEMPKKIENRRTELPTNPDIFKDEDLKAIKESFEKEIGNTMSVDEQIQAIQELDSKKLDNKLPDTSSKIVDKLSENSITFKEKVTQMRKLITNKGAAVDDLFKATGNKQGKWKYDRYLGSFNEGQVSVGVRQINSNGKIVGDSLIDIYDNAKKSGITQKILDDYVLNKDNISRAKYEKYLYGEEISAQDSQRIIDEYDKKYPQLKDYAKQVSDYANNNTKGYLVGSFISEDLYNQLRQMYPDHVPVIRDIAETPGIVEYDNVGSQVLKKAKGGNKDILSPKESLAQQSISYARAFRRNEALREVYKSIKSDTKVLYDLGKIIDIEQANDCIKNAISYDDSLNKYTATVFENGEAKVFEISKDIFDAFSNDTLISKVDRAVEKSLPGKILKKASSGFKSLTTGKNILYAAKNMVRDINDAPINSTTNFANYMKDWGYAYEQIVTDGKYYQEYVNAGGTANTFYDYNKGLIKKEFNSLPRKAVDFLNNQTIGRVEQINEVVETAPRLAEYIATRERGGSIDEALYNASEVTTNFKRGGELAKLADKYGIPYLNASIQGLSKLYRNISGANGLKRYAKLVINATLAGVLPSLINHLVYEEDDDYEELPDYLKDGYYLIKVDNLPEGMKEKLSEWTENNFIRVPKGRVSAVLGGTAVRMHETLSQEGEDTWDGYINDVVLNNIGINNPLTNNIASGLIQATRNEAWYGGSIYSENKYKNKLPVEITDEKTTEFSNWVAQTLYDIIPEETYKKLIDDEMRNPLFKVIATPKLLDYAIDQYSGIVGDIIMPMLTPYAENNPLIDQFTTSNTLKNKTANKFYEILGNCYQDSQYATDTDKLTYQYLLNVSKDIGDLYKQKSEIQNSEYLKDKSKRIKTYEIQDKINKKMKEAIKSVENLTINENSAKFNDTDYYKDTDGNWQEVKDEDRIKGLSTETYASYKNKISVETKEKKKREGKDNIQLTDREKAKVLLDSAYSDKEKKILYSEIVNSNDSTYQLLSKLENININAYLDYKTQEIKGTEDEKSIVKGKTISGSKKKNLINYLNSSKLSTLDKVYIFGKSNKLDNSQRKIIQDAINNSSLTEEEKKEFYRGLGSSNIEELKDGTIRWK